MSNVNNLIPNSKRTPDELRKNAIKGGLASGKARREKKTVYNVAKMLLDLPELNSDLVSIMEELGIEKSEQTIRMAILVKLLRNVLDKGCVQSAKLLLQAAQELPTKQDIGIVGTRGDSVFIKQFILPSDDELKNIEDE